MRTRNAQKGLTMWGIMFMILVGVFFLFLFFKLFPAYMEDFEISSQMDGMAQEFRGKDVSSDVLISSLEKRFEIEDINNVVPSRDVKIVPQGNGVAVNLNYTVEIPMAGNVSVLLYFNHHVPVR